MKGSQSENSHNERRMEEQTKAFLYYQLFFTKICDRRDLWHHRVIILGGMMVHFFSQSSKKDQLFLTNQSIEAPEKNSSETKPIDETVSTSTRSVIYVDVKGAVKQPGMYAFVAEDRVFDVIQKAGGLTESADEKQINFAAKITDQQMLYVPEVGEEIPESSNASLATLDSVDTNPDRVHLNTADLSQLQQIPGIGEKKPEKLFSIDKIMDRSKVLTSFKK